jgi:hypothetical protein
MPPGAFILRLLNPYFNRPTFLGMTQEPPPSSSHLIPLGLQKECSPFFVQV